MRLMLVLTALLATGCSCSQDYGIGSNFGTLAEPETDDPPSNFGPYLSFDASPEGSRLTMSYYDVGSRAVGYAVGTPGADGEVVWVHEHVDGYKSEDNDVGMYSTQRTAKDGTVWVAYHDAEELTLKARHRLGGGVWADAEVVAPGGKWASMTTVASRPVVVHGDTTGELKLSTLEDGAWATEVIYTSTATNWPLDDGTTEVRPGEVGQARVLFSGDRLYVAVHDVAKGELHLLTGDAEATGASDFEGAVVDKGDVGAWPSMVMNDGELHIAYQDLANQDLKLAVSKNDRFEIEVVDDGQLVGSDSEIYLTDAGVEMIYFDGWEGDLRQAKADGNGWASDRLAGTSTAMGFHNETKKIGDTRYVGTYDYTNRAFNLLTIE